MALSSFYLFCFPSFSFLMQLFRFEIYKGVFVISCSRERWRKKRVFFSVFILIQLLNSKYMYKDVFVISGSRGRRRTGIGAGKRPDES